jgi:glycosyltransferase A (GT-A) superfamily protein (DUF2064 family)
LDGRARRASIDASLQNSMRIETRVYTKKLGILLHVPEPGVGHGVLPPPVAAAASRDLHRAFIADLFARIAKLKKVPTTAFSAGDGAAVVDDLIPERCRLVKQEAVSESERIEHALGVLLENEGSLVCLIGSTSPDLPLVHLKRAYAKLKHRDVILGPTFEGGLYLIALKARVTGLFQDIVWNDRMAFRGVLDRVRSKGLACALLPPWYDGNATENLSLLETMLLARRIEGRDRLRHVERVLDRLGGAGK